VDQDSHVKEYGLKPNHSYRHALNGFAAGLDAEKVKKLKQDSRVLAVEPDGRVVPCAQTIPAGVLRMGIPTFPLVHMDGRDHRIDVDVAVLDTGVQTNHPDLNVVQSVDFTGTGPNDNTGHGTGMAGCIGALDNDFGVVGVAPGARIWSVKVLDPAVQSSWSFILAGIEYIFTNANRISVVNASFKGYADTPAPYTALHTAVSNLVSQGVVFVASAGNNSADIAGANEDYSPIYCVLPAALSEVMAVSAMDPNPTNSDGSVNTNFDTFPYFSNYSFVPKPNCPVLSPGAGIDLAAPGVNILTTTTNGGYALYSGTSLSCAYVSGLVALYIAANGRAHTLQDVYAIRQAIINNSQPQSAWHPGDAYAYVDCNFTGDPDGNPEPLATPSETWVPPTITSEGFTPGGFQIGFQTLAGRADSVSFTESP